MTPAKIPSPEVGKVYFVLRHNLLSSLKSIGLSCVLRQIACFSFIIENCNLQ